MALFEGKLQECFQQQTLIVRKGGEEGWAEIRRKLPGKQLYTKSRKNRRANALCASHRGKPLA